MTTVLVSCGGDDKKDDETAAEQSSTSAGIAPNVAFAGMLTSMEKAPFAVFVDMDALINESGIENSPNAQAVGMMKALLAGVDMSQPIRMTGDKVGGKDVFVVMMALESKEAYEEGLVGGMGEEAPEQKAGYSVAKLNFMGQLRLLTAYNDEYCLFLHSDGYLKKEEFEGYIDQLFQYAKQTPDAELQAYVDAQHDLAVIGNPSRGMQAGGMEEEKASLLAMNEEMAGLIEMMQSSADGWGAFTLDFEDGEIVMEGGGAGGAEMMDALGSQEFPANMGNCLSADELYGYGGFSVELGGLMEAWKTGPASKYYEEAKAKMGFDPAMIADVIDGTLAIGITGLDLESMFKDTDDSELTDLADDSFAKLEGEEVDAEEVVEEVGESADVWKQHIVVAIGVKDINLLKSVLDTSSNMVKDGMVYTKDGTFMLLDEENGKMIITSNEAVASRWVGDGLAQHEVPYLKAPMGGYFSFEKMATLIAESEIDKEDHKNAIELIGIMSDATMEIVNGHGVVRLRFKDASANALRQLVDLFGDQMKIPGLPM